MTPLPDETLIAYADGQLDAVETARIRHLLMCDPALLARLEVFRATGDLSSLFDAHMNSPLPDKLQRLKQEAEETRAQSIDLGLRRKRQPFREIGGLRLAAAAAAILAAGIGLGWLMRESAGGSGAAVAELIKLKDNRLLARQPLRMALDSLPSGNETTIALPESKTLKIAVKLSFKDHSKDYCRQYEIGLSSPERYEGIACYKEGEWRIELHALLAPQRPQPGKTTPAANKSGALEGSVLAMIDGDALGKDDEAAAIAKGWKR